MIAAQNIEIALHIDLRSRDGRTPEGNTIPDLSKYFLKPQGLIAAITSNLKSSSALVQLNGVVSASDLSEVKLLHPSSRFILPIGEAHLSLPDETLGDYLSSVAASVDYFLFDCSGGLGKVFSLEAFKRFAQAARTYAPSGDLGFSGGLSPQNIQMHVDQMRSDTKLQQLAPIEALSIDVESGIRSTTHDGQDRVDHTKLTAFIQSAVRALTRAA
jgi:phosphoribosylanthranilate isomerase